MPENRSALRETTPSEPSYNFQLRHRRLRRRFSMWPCRSHAPMRQHRICVVRTLQHSRRVVKCWGAPQSVRAGLVPASCCRSSSLVPTRRDMIISTACVPHRDCFNSLAMPCGVFPMMCDRVPNGVCRRSQSHLAVLHLPAAGARMEGQRGVSRSSVRQGFFDF